MPTTRILCVDDEPQILLLLPQILKLHGYEVTTAGTVPEALNIITSSERFDVLISDLNMGHIADGFTIVHTMRRVNPACINFILTGYPAFETALQALRQQVDDYLTKPSDIPTLVRSIEEKLQNRLPSPRYPVLRLSAILRNNLDTILSRTLVNLKADPELAALQLSDKELLGTLDSKIRDLADQLDSELPNEASEVSLRSAHLGGERRQEQPYSLKLVATRNRLVMQAINHVVYEHLLNVNLSYLLLDLNKLNDAMLMQLEESINSYLQAEGRKEGRKEG